MDASQGHSPHYLLGHTPAAIHRLLIQGQLINPFTRQVLADAGLTAGMRVLDVGCGPGDVSLIAAELVGEVGQVLGVDANAAVLEIARSRAQDAGLQHVSFVSGDLLDLPLDQEFDAIVGRLILMHLPDPSQTLRQLSAHLRVGGVIVFQEYDLGDRPDICYPPSLLWDQVWRAKTETFERAGGETRMGMKLFSAFQNAGLPDSQLRFEAAIGAGPDWLGYEWYAETVRTFLPQAQQYGIIAPGEIDIDTLATRLRDETVLHLATVHLPVLVSAWSRKQPA